MRDVHDLKTQQVDDSTLQQWADAVHALYLRALGWAAQATAHTPTERDQARRAFERELLALCRSQPATSPQATLCQRVERSHSELFMFVADPAVPATNNEAERALRPLVIARKISGGTRSANGSRTRMTLQSLIATWEVRHQDAIAAMLTLLQNSPPRERKLVPV